ncbi:D-alanyl-D-alanine carboxypeptidase/D-alanyl-D-alanine-endopeptidase (penicillin-binding protein 4) [Alloalcanivorax xenomutans]|jgi:serine-type D-Ala-D-Ala carboxypeptidase/endopeptidase (penicillin-binding protein 4)|nr:D-alanyl-D-alanine carboxypeptidase/D-alanyl-D-alanine-endopeptidase (penicillin-binding protein 4) [Alloalcanivorax xenomutans]
MQYSREPALTMTCRPFWLSLFLMFVAISPAGAESWADSIYESLQERKLPEESLSLAAIPLDGPGEPRFVNADEQMNPGSTMKLVTTYAALELLGPNFQWHTRLYTDGEQKGDTLKGNLYYVGVGDPKLTLERMWLLLRDLRAMGIKHIRGDLVLDGSYFHLPNGIPHFNDDGDNPYAPYLVEPSALLTNLNVFRIRMMSRDGKVHVSTEPPVSKIVIDNQVTAPERGRCPVHNSKALQYEPDFSDRRKITVTITGALPENCRADRYLSLMSQEDYTANLIRGLWREMGGTLSGRDRTGRLARGAKLLVTTSSPDLVTMVRDINKWSSNIMARQLFLTIGAENRLAGDKDDLAAADRAILEWMRLKGIDISQVVLENGSGLSRVERITAHQQALMLQQAWRSPFAAELIASLPLVAMDGTMRNRLRNTALVGEGHIKTGTLRNVRSIAGFTRDQNNTTWAVAAMINDRSAWKSRAVLDEVLKAVHTLVEPGTDASRVTAASAGGGR